MVRHATETPKPLQQFNPAIPDGLQQIVNYMIAKQPAQRYPKPERAAQALQMFLMADSQAPAPVDEPPQMRKYLTWLETAPSEPETRQAAAARMTGTPAHPLGVLDTLPVARPSSAPSMHAAAALSLRVARNTKNTAGAETCPSPNPPPPFTRKCLTWSWCPWRETFPWLQSEPLGTAKRSD